MSVESLAEKLREMVTGEISDEKVLTEIREASPLEISKAEQKLLDSEDIDEGDLREFCKIHLQAVQEEAEMLKEKAGEGHPITTLVREHEEIIHMLDRLDELGDSLKREDLDEEEKEELYHISEHIVETEKHHEREEEVLFPRMENEGITGPTRIMKLEHEDMWPKKERLNELAEDIEDNEEEIMELIGYLSLNLRDHIFKENNILYPSAFDELEDWEEIRKEMDEIGYCCFTPGDEVK